jgi:tRNA pseudouridine65 synthase
VLVFALDAGIASRVGALFEGREVAKRYLAVVRGWPAAAGEIDYPLGVVRDGHHSGDHEPSLRQPAVTRFRTLATVELPVRVDRYPSSRYALMELEPVTGRRHQLRRHLHHVSHPVIGDTSYGKGRHNRLFEETFGCRRMLLACTGVGFAHPATGRVLQLEASVDGSFANVLQELGWTKADVPMKS